MSTVGLNTATVQKYIREQETQDQIEDKMSRKIYKGILRKKKRMVFGFDARVMDGLYRHFPKKSLRLFRNVMRKAKVDLFKDIF